MGLQREMLPEHRPSVFYRLLELEGPSGALEAWKAAEDASQHSATQRQQRVKDAAHIAKENARSVRRTFADSWQFLQRSSTTRKLLGQLESAAANAFGAHPVAMLWMLDWDGTCFETKFGTPPA